MKIPLFKERGFEEALEEITICTLLPDGILSNSVSKYFSNIKQKKINNLKKYSDLEDFVIFNSIKFTKEYVDKNKQIDQKYINLVLKTILNFSKTCKK